MVIYNANNYHWVLAMVIMHYTACLTPIVSLGIIYLGK
jgi:hypothetical protein